MNTGEIKERLHRYIDAANEKKLYVIYAIVEDEMESADDHWEDASFIAELERRYQSYQSGAVKAYPADESVKRAKQALKNKNR